MIKEISILIEGQYQRAIALLQKIKINYYSCRYFNRKEVIFKDDLEVIFGTRPFEFSRRKYYSYKTNQHLLRF
jgi:cell division protease FtsH